MLFNAQNVWAVVAEVWALSAAPKVPIFVFLFGRSVQAQRTYPSFWALGDVVEGPKKKQSGAVQKDSA